MIKGLRLHSATTLLTGAASFGAVAFVIGVPIGAGVVAHLAVHELGHALAFRYHGMTHEPIRFVPFLGASISAHDDFDSAHCQGTVALAGPAAGAVATMVTAACAELMTSTIAWQVCTIGAAINLVNLIPVGRLDGGRIAMSFNRNVLAIGTTASCALLYMDNPSNLLHFGFIAAWVYSSGREYARGNANYARKTFTSQRLAIALAYTCVSGTLGSLLWYSTTHHKTPITIRDDAVKIYSRASDLVGYPLLTKCTLECTGAKELAITRLLIAEIAAREPWLKLKMGTIDDEKFTIKFTVPFHNRDEILKMIN